MDEPTTNASSAPPAAATRLPDVLGETVDQILRQTGAMRVAPLPPLDVADLVRYLCGTLPPIQRQAIERQLVTQPAGRVLLRQVRVTLTALQKVSFQEAAQRVHDQDLTARVAQVWLPLVTQRVETLPTAREHWKGRDWEALRQAAAQGIAEARLAWSAFWAFGQQIRAELSRPRLATVKGAANDGPRMTGDLESLGRALFEARITDNDALVVELTLSIHTDVRVSYTAHTLEGRTLHLSITLHSETWYLGAAILSESRAAWTLPDFGAALNLPPGRLPSDLFAVALETPVAETLPTQMPLLCSVTQADRQVSNHPPALIEIEHPFRRDKDGLAAVVFLPSLVRTTLARYTLELDLLVSPQQAQRLGAWPVSDWTQEARTLPLPLPSSEEALFLPVSCLRAQFVAPALS